jgi:hypothetical protein
MAKLRQRSSDDSDVEEMPKLKKRAVASDDDEEPEGAPTSETGDDEEVPEEEYEIESIMDHSMDAFPDVCFIRSFNPVSVEELIRLSWTRF